MVKKTKQAGILTIHMTIYRQEGTFLYLQEYAKFYANVGAVQLKFIFRNRVYSIILLHKRVGSIFYKTR